MDLGGRRPGSFRPSSFTRPPPISRSQSLVANDFDTNQEFPAEIKNFLGQTEEKVELSDSKTLDSPVHKVNPTRTQKASCDRSAKDFPAYMRKVQRKKEKKKNDKIEKIFFV